MGAQVGERGMEIGSPIITFNGMFSMMVLILIIFYTIYQFRSSGYRIEQEIRRASMTVFYSSFLLAFIQVLLWSGIMTEKKDCDWIVKINVITLTATKMALYYLYTVRLDYTFRGSEWEIPPIILFFIRIAIVLVFGIVAVIMIVEIKPGTTGDTDWGIYCNIQLGAGILWVYGSVDFFITTYLLYLFSSRLFRVSQKVGTTLSKKDNALYHLVRLLTFLTLISIISSWLITYGYAVYKPIAWFTSVDFLFNAICVFAMFEFMHVVDRIRYAGLLFCCLCTIVWPANRRKEYLSFLESVEAANEARIQMQIEEQRARYAAQTGMAYPVDLEIQKNEQKQQQNKKNKKKSKKNKQNMEKNDDKNEVETNTGTQGNDSIRRQSGPSGEKQASQPNLNGDTLGTNATNATNGNNSGRPTTPVPHPNDMDQNGTQKRKEIDQNDGNEEQIEVVNELNATGGTELIGVHGMPGMKVYEREERNMTTTSDLDLENTRHTDVIENVEESGQAEWTIASDMVSSEQQEEQMQTGLVANNNNNNNNNGANGKNADNDAVQQANYAMEMMQLHMNVDRF